MTFPPKSPPRSRARRREGPSRHPCPAVVARRRPGSPRRCACRHRRFEHRCARFSRLCLGNIARAGRGTARRTRRPHCRSRGEPVRLTPHHRSPRHGRGSPFSASQRPLRPHADRPGPTRGSHGRHGRPQVRRLRRLPAPAELRCLRRFARRHQSWPPRVATSLAPRRITRARASLIGADVLASHELAR